MATKFPMVGVLGALAVAAGAAGAHGAWAEHLEAIGRLEQWNTGVRYHLIHTVVLLVLALGESRGCTLKWPFFLVLSGMAIFSGSLYLLAATNTAWLGAITPFGGLLLILGWLRIGWITPCRKDEL